RERVALVHQIRHFPASTSYSSPRSEGEQKEFTEQQANWYLSVAKNIGACTELPEGTMILHANGCLRKVGYVHEDGLCVHMMRSQGSILTPSMLLFRGTKLDSLISLQENARHPIGIKGVTLALTEIEQFMTNPEKGFVRKSNEQLAIVAYSLGTAQSSRVALEYVDRFSKMTFVCGVGFEKTSALQYKDRLAAIEPQKRPFPTIEHYYEQGDLVPHFGEHRIGYQLTEDEAEVIQHYVVDKHLADL